MIRVSSIFSQMLQLFSRTEFERAVVEHRAERHARGFSCWGQFVAMLFCHLGRAQSLREICGGLAASEGKLRHLGLPDAPKRSTLAYANEHRPWQLYRSVFYQLLARCREVAGPHGFRFKNKLLTLDATLIELCASGLRLGAVPAHERSREAASAARSSGVAAQLRAHHRRPRARKPRGAQLAFRARNHRGFRSRLRRLRLVRLARRRGRVISSPA